MSGITVERLGVPATAQDIDELAKLLVDAVGSGASVSFMAGLTLDDARAWWIRWLDGATPRSIVLVARDDAGIVGSVQVHGSWAPNQPHRADLSKLIVHRRARGQGVGRRLMVEVTAQAAAEGFALIVLDTVPDSVAHRLYQSLGWTVVGAIPGYAYDPAGALCDTVIFYKQL